MRSLFPRPTGLVQIPRDQRASIAGPVTNVITKLVTETIQSSSTLHDDAELQFPMAANTNYRIRAYVIYTTADTPDIKITASGPSGATRIAYAAIKGAPGDFPAFQKIQTAYTTFPQLNATGNTGFHQVDLVVYNGATAGLFSVKWAQNTLDVGDTSVLAGSYLEYTVIGIAA